MQVVIFHLMQNIELDDAWYALAMDGCELLYSNEEADGSKEIIGHLPINISQTELMEKHPCIRSIQNTKLPNIDWDSQWELHGSDYKQGCVHIDMRHYVHEHQLIIKELKLSPGPGFGDHSHSTTQLVLELMGELNMHGKCVIDIGSGSGILSLAAHAMGATSVYGIDIDELAIEHSKENALLNGIENIHFFTPEQCGKHLPKSRYVALMNMIQSEQVQAWKSLSSAHSSIEIIITSGILIEGRQEYLSQCSKWGWKLLHEKEKDGWLGFVFRQ